MIITGKWQAFKSYEGYFKAGEEFSKVFYQKNPRELGEYRFTFISPTRPTFDIETYDNTHLIKDGYVAWVPPFINDILNDDVKGQIGAILSDDSYCNLGTIEYLYTLCPLEATVWPYLAGHDAAHYYLPEVGKRSKETALPFFTKLYHEKSNPFPVMTLAVLAAAGSPIALPKVIEKLATKDPIARRQAYAQLESFEGPDVDALLERGLQDSNWNVQMVVKKLIADRNRPKTSK